MRISYILVIGLVLGVVACKGDDSASKDVLATEDLSNAEDGEATDDLAGTEELPISEEVSVADDTQVPPTDEGGGIDPDVGTPNPDAGTVDVVADTGTPEDSGNQSTELVLPKGLNGDAVEGFPAPPAFSGVVNTKNEDVDVTTLNGHWTVMWFYPAANTFG